MLAHDSAKTQHSIEMLKAVLEAGKSALHALLIINGGAVIALLGVISNLVGKSDGSVLARYLSLPLLQFGIGVLLGAIGFAFRYLSQACYSESGNPHASYTLRAMDFATPQSCQQFLATFSSASQ